MSQEASAGPGGAAESIREPKWLPLGKYEHGGKEVLKFTHWADASGRDVWKVHYVDGSVHREAQAEQTKADEYRTLIHGFGFKTYKYSVDDMAEGLEACPQEDPGEFVERKSGPPQNESGWLRKDTLAEYFDVFYQ